MKLGIDGKWALVCAASKGTWQRLRQSAGDRRCERGHHGTRRRSAGSDRRRTAHAEPAVKVVTVSGDITTAEGRAAALAAAPHIDILINNAGGPPPGDFRNWTRDDWIKAVDANMLTPIELMKAVIDGMCERGFRPHRQHHVGRREGPDRHAGLVQRRPLGAHRFCRRSRPAAKSGSRNVTINGLLPGPFDTDRMRACSPTGQNAMANPSPRRPVRACRRIRRNAWATSTNSAPPAPSSAVSTPVSSPGKTS